VKIFFVNENLPDRYIRVLQKYGRTEKLPPSSAIPLPVGAHPDTLVGKTGNVLYVHRGDEKVAQTLRKCGADVRLSDHKIGEKYPFDCALNYFTVKNFFVGKLDTVSRMALDDAVNAGYEPINVAQGYAHCASAVVGGGVITADTGIYDALSSRGVPSLLIESGGVSLPPYQYGFIGGACGAVDEETVLFFGDITAHKSGNAIAGFCRERGVTVINGDGKLFDYGGIIAIDI